MYKNYTNFQLIMTVSNIAKTICIGPVGRWRSQRKGHTDTSKSRGLAEKSSKLS